MAQELLLFEAEEDENDIVADISEHHMEMLDEIDESMDGGEGATIEDADVLLANVVQKTLHASVMDMQDNTDEIHQLYADMILSLQDTGEIDLDSLVENAIHNIFQQTD